MSSATLQPVRDVCERLGIEPTPRMLCASVVDQRMADYRQIGGWEFDEEYRLVISTSRFGIGQKEDSNKTPLGLHRIAEKIGGDGHTDFYLPVGPQELGCHSGHNHRHGQVCEAEEPKE